MKSKILITLFVIIFCSCTPTKEDQSIVNGLKIIKIDSCEYLFGDWGYSSVLTHKGNCKFCAKRNHN